MNHVVGVPSSIVIPPVIKAKADPQAAHYPAATDQESPLIGIHPQQLSSHTREYPAMNNPTAASTWASASFSVLNRCEVSNIRNVGSPVTRPMN